MTQNGTPSNPRHPIAVGVLTAAAVAACGPVVGALWVWLAPRGEAVVAADGVYVAHPDGQAAIAADGSFAVIGLGAGLLCGIVVYLATRGRGVAAALGMAAGGSAGSLVAWLTGVWLGPGSVRVAARGADVGTRIDLPLDLGARGVLLVWPIAAVAVLMILTAALDRVDPPGAWRPRGPVG